MCVHSCPTFSWEIPRSLEISQNFPGLLSLSCCSLVNMVVHFTLTQEQRNPGILTPMEKHRLCRLTKIGNWDYPFKRATRISDWHSTVCLPYCEKFLLSRYPLDGSRVFWRPYDSSNARRYFSTSTWIFSKSNGPFTMFSIWINSSRLFRISGSLHLSSTAFLQSAK